MAEGVLGVQLGLEQAAEHMSRSNGVALEAAREAEKIGLGEVTKQLEGVAGLLAVKAMAVHGLGFEPANTERENAGGIYQEVLNGVGDHQAVKDLFAALNQGGEEMKSGMEAKGRLGSLLANVGAAVVALAEELTKEGEPLVAHLADKGKEAATQGTVVIEKAEAYSANL